MEARTTRPFAAAPLPGNGRAETVPIVMDPSLASGIARYAHRGRRDRFGESVVSHLARVAAAVPDDARATAWLHDILEASEIDPAELLSEGLSPAERDALELLTRVPGEIYKLYVRRIANAPGDAGRLARAVKLADLDDRLTHHGSAPDAPPYAWARRHIACAQLRRHELLAGAESGAA